MGAITAYSDINSGAIIASTDTNTGGLLLQPETPMLGIITTATDTINGAYFAPILSSVNVAFGIRWRGGKPLQLPLSSSKFSL